MEDIEFIAGLEKRIEEENAASKETLLSRFKMFPEGFFIAEQSEKIVGYAESVLWDKEEFKTFEEVRNFPENHNPKGKILYVIFLAVDKKYRRRGIGSSLIKQFQKYALRDNLDKIHLVAGEGFLIDFYERLGFKVIKTLPKFLPYSDGTLMEYKIKNN